MCVEEQQGFSFRFCMTPPSPPLPLQEGKQASPCKERWGGREQPAGGGGEQPAAGGRGQAARVDEVGEEL